MMVKEWISWLGKANWCNMALYDQYHSFMCNEK